MLSELPMAVGSIALFGLVRSPHGPTSVMTYFADEGLSSRHLVKAGRIVCWMGSRLACPSGMSGGSKSSRHARNRDKCGLLETYWHGFRELIGYKHHRFVSCSVRPLQGFQLRNAGPSSYK